MGKKPIKLETTLERKFWAFSSGIEPSLQWIEHVLWLVTWSVWSIWLEVFTCPIWAMGSDIHVNGPFYSPWWTSQDLHPKSACPNLRVDSLAVYITYVVCEYARFNFIVLSVKQANDIAFDWVLRDSKVVSNVIFTCLLSNTTGTSSECRGIAILITLSHKLKMLQEVLMLTKPV